MEQTRPGERLVTIVAGLDESQAKISVRDRGCGLDAEATDRLFEPFFTTKDKGLGLGLAISRSIVESHKGRLWAEANPDHGMTLHFTLPTASKIA
jgi:two-component system sensor kinase FixL